MVKWPYTVKIIKKKNGHEILGENAVHTHKNSSSRNLKKIYLIKNTLTEQKCFKKNIHQNY